MTRKLLSVLSLFFISIGSYAQELSHTLTGGIGLSMGGTLRAESQGYTFDPTLTEAGNYDVTTSDISYDRVFFFPKLTLQYGFNIGEYTQLTLSGSWKGLRNSVIRFETYNEDNNQFTTDTFFVRTNAAELNADFRFYTDYVSEGLYFSTGLGATFLGNEILPVYNTRNGFGYVQEVKPKAYMNANYFNVSVGLGFTHTFNEKHILDYGGKLNYYFGSLLLNSVIPSPQNTPESNYKENFRTYLRLSNIQNLQHYNALEIYVRYGITW